MSDRLRLVFRKRSDKVSKGYRLKPETHELINKIQAVLNSDQDTAIYNACENYFEILKDRMSENELIQNQ